MNYYITTRYDMEYTLTKRTVNYSTLGVGDYFEFEGTVYKKIIPAALSNGVYARVIDISSDSVHEFTDTTAEVIPLEYDPLVLRYKTV